MVLNMYGAMVGNRNKEFVVVLRTSLRAMEAEADRSCALGKVSLPCRDSLDELSYFARRRSRTAPLGEQ